MDPRRKGSDSAKKAGFVGDRSMDDSFDQDDVPGSAKEAGIDANDGAHLSGRRRAGAE